MQATCSVVNIVSMSERTVPWSLPGLMPTRSARLVRCSLWKRDAHPQLKLPARRKVVARRRLPADRQRRRLVRWALGRVR